MTTYPEDRVLEPLDPIPDDVNEWPDFALREVKIFYQGKGRYADLLEASEETPLCVLGELMPLDDEQETLALIDRPVYARIKVDNVTNYSFGQDDQGKPVIWAAGRAGWYEISPSDRYLTHYNDTIEAIDLFYFMVDQHQKLPKARARLGFLIDPFLTEYQKHTGYRIDDDDEAMETIHKHHKFILKQMIEEREDIDWSQTHLWRHLNETYVEEVEQLKNTLAQMQITAHVPELESSSSESASASSESDDEEAVAVSQKTPQQEAGSSVRSDSETSSASESESESDSEESEKEEDKTEAEVETAAEEEEQEEEEDSTDWTKPIWDLLNILRKTANFDIRNCGIDQLATEVEKMPAFSGSHKAAAKAIERSAEPLLRLMNEAKLRKKFNWSTRAIYAELEATLADDVARDIMKTPAAKPGKQRHRMKSVLRPSGAGKARKRTRAAGPGQDTSEDDDAVMAEAPISSPVAKRNIPSIVARRIREQTFDSAASRDDSPSRQLNGHYDPHALPELPPGPEAQEMLDLVASEARMVGRQNQTSHLEAFLGQWNM